jgi:hypothetical protein
MSDAAPARVARQSKAEALEAEMRSRYAHVFGSTEGAEVLRNLMANFGFDPKTGVELLNRENNGVVEGGKNVVRHILDFSGYTLFP